MTPEEIAKIAHPEDFESQRLLAGLIRSYGESLIPLTQTEKEWIPESRLRKLLDKTPAAMRVIRKKGINGKPLRWTMTNGRDALYSIKDLEEILKSNVYVGNNH